MPQLAPRRRSRGSPACIACGVARGGQPHRLYGRSDARQRGGNPAERCRKQRRRRCHGRGSESAIARTALRASYFLQCREEGNDVLDLLGAQDRLAGIGRRDPVEAFGAVIGRHDRVRVDAAGIDEPQRS